MQTGRFMSLHRRRTGIIFLIFIYAPHALLPPYRDEDMEILGIAVTYWEALEVVRQMVEDMYRCCGERLESAGSSCIAVRERSTEIETVGMTAC